MSVNIEHVLHHMQNQIMSKQDADKHRTAPITKCINFKMSALLHKIVLQKSQNFTTCRGELGFIEVVAEKYKIKMQ